MIVPLMIIAVLMAWSESIRWKLGQPEHVAELERLRKTRKLVNIAIVLLLIYPVVVVAMIVFRQFVQ